MKCPFVINKHGKLCKRDLLWYKAIQFLKRTIKSMQEETANKIASNSFERI